jgi:hypothetical protein
MVGDSCSQREDMVGAATHWFEKFRVTFTHLEFHDRLSYYALRQIFVSGSKS